MGDGEDVCNGVVMALLGQVIEIGDVEKLNPGVPDNGDVEKASTQRDNTEIQGGHFTSQSMISTNADVTPEHEKEICNNKSDDLHATLSTNNDYISEHAEVLNNHQNSSSSFNPNYEQNTSGANDVGRNRNVNANMDAEGDSGSNNNHIETRVNQVEIDNLQRRSDNQSPTNEEGTIQIDKILRLEHADQNSTPISDTSTNFVIITKSNDRQTLINNCWKICTESR